jgi:hypothetical protein
MRTFYIFNISDYLSVLTHDNPYNLYRTLEGVYYLDKSELEVGINLFDQIAIPFHKEEINRLIFEQCKNNDFYTVKGNHHKIYNKYLDELTEIDTHFTYIMVKSNTTKLNLLKNILINKNLFA